MPSNVPEKQRIMMNFDEGGERTKSQVLENTTRRHPRICPTGSAKTHAIAPASSVDDNNAGP